MNDTARLALEQTAEAADGAATYWEGRRTHLQAELDTATEHRDRALQTGVDLREELARP